MAQQEQSPGSKVKTLNTWVRDARYALRDARAESWRDQEMYDGEHWDDKDQKAAEEANITPLTINRIFPVINLVLGHHEVNPLDVIAKGRTQKDTDLAQLMTQGIQFVMDQNEGKYKISTAFKDAVIPGFGFLQVDENQDPRQENIRVSYRDWKDMWWDPFGSPWIDPNSCKYVFYSKWIDLDTLQAMFPDKKKEIEEKFSQLAGDAMTTDEQGYMDFDDEGSEVEEYKRTQMGAGWVDKLRKRVRPVEMWHYKYKKTFFARMPDGSVFELDENMPATEQFQLIQRSQTVIPANVRKMIRTLFLGDLVLSDQWSPYAHDLFPFVPFVGYLDRYNNPYGVPRQLRGQNMEVNKRRSMALALLGSKRVVAESNVASDPKGLQNVFEEAQKINGFVTIEPSVVGAPVTNRIAIQDQSALAQPEVELMLQSEREIQEISGANDESMGYSSNAESGKAIELRQQKGQTVMAPIYGNVRRSMSRLGYLIQSEIQRTWKAPKMLRVTDEMTGVDRFVELNKPVQLQTGEVRRINDITQGKYDLIVSESPATDTVREKNLELIIEWIKRSPPEVAPTLLTIAMELSNLPKKDKILAKIKPLMGQNPADEDKSPEELKQEAIQKLEAQQQEQAQMSQIQKQMLQAQMEEQMLKVKELEAKIQSEYAGHAETEADVDKTRAETAKILASIQAEREKIQQNIEKLSLEGIKTGFDMQDRMAQRRLDAMEIKQKDVESTRNRLNQV